MGSRQILIVQVKLTYPWIVFPVYQLFFLFPSIYHLLTNNLNLLNHFISCFSLSQISWFRSTSLVHNIKQYLLQYLKFIRFALLFSFLIYISFLYYIDFASASNKDKIKHKHTKDFCKQVNHYLTCEKLSNFFFGATKW